MNPDLKNDLDLSDLHLLLRAENLKSAPQCLLRIAESTFHQPAQQLVRAPAIPEMLMYPVFDSSNQPTLAGTRGGAAPARQIVLRAEGFDIHLKIWGASAGRRLAGQILAWGERSFVRGSRLHLLRDGERIVSAVVNTFGEFEFELLPAGFLSLQVDLPHLTLVGELNTNEAA